MIMIMIIIIIIIIIKVMNRKYINFNNILLVEGIDQ